MSSPIYTLVCINEKQQAEALVSVRKFFLILAGAACLFVFTSGWAEVIHPLLLLAACYSLHPQFHIRQRSSGTPANNSFIPNLVLTLSRYILFFYLYPLFLLKPPEHNFCD